MVEWKPEHFISKNVLDETWELVKLSLDCRHLEAPWVLVFLTEMVRLWFIWSMLFQVCVYGL